MNGKCLCGAVEFEIVGQLPKIYQCHCSQCRKVTGSASNSGLIVPVKQFRWIRGTEHICSYTSGYRSDFCCRCGSPVPNPLREKPMYWVPVGLLEDDSKIEIAAHIFVGSKANWDTIADNGIQFQEIPDFGYFLEVLQPK
jgi:hypothetical protein